MSSKKSPAPAGELSDVELFRHKYGYLKNHKATTSGPSKWSGVAMSIQNKKNVGQQFSSVIWIDAEVSHKYGIDAQPGLRFIIYSEGQRVMIETAPKGSTEGVKATISKNGAVAVNWNAVPKNMRLDKVRPRTITNVDAISADGVVCLAWELPDWFFARKEEAAA